MKKTTLPQSGRENWLIPERTAAGAEALGNDWLRDVQSSGYPETTVRTYANTVRRFCEYAAAAGLPEDMREIEARHLRDYRSAMREEGLSANTISVREAILRIWWGWLIRQDELTQNPWTRLVRYHKEIKPQRPPTLDQIQAMINAVKDRKRGPGRAVWLSLRDTALIGMLFDTGLRAGEITSIRRGDVTSHQTIEIRGKGGKYRTVLLSDNVFNAVRKYLRAFERSRGVQSSDDALWQGIHGPLTKRGLHTMITTAGALVGISVHPHLLRHGFATRYLEAGGDRWAVQVIAGWASETMLKRYTSTLDGNRALRDHREHSPARALKL